MEAKINALTQSEALITKFSTNTRKTAKTKQTKGFLTVRGTLLRQYWSKYVARYEELDRDPDSNLTKRQEEGTVMTYDEVERIYGETLGELEDLSAELMSPLADNSLAHSSNTSFERQTAVHSTLSPTLPRLKIPQFDGSFLNWYSFKDLFGSVVIKNMSISNTERLQYLKDSLIGSAKPALDNITTTDANFCVAWELLESKYDNKRIIINAHLTEIIKLPLMRKESAADLRALVDSVTSSLRALEHLNRPVDHWDDWLVYTVVHKLDTATIRAWELSISGSTTLPTFENLRQFLGNYIKSLEIVHDFGDTKSPSSTKETSQVTPRKQGVKGYHTTIDSCPCCSNNHYILFCTGFRNQTVQQKRNTAVKANLCLNCLRPGHKLKECPSTRRCQKCKAPHHTVLHEYFDTATHSSTTSVNPVGTSQDFAANFAAVHKTAITGSRLGTTTAMLLGTAIVEVHSSTGHSLKLRALLDSGSEATFISEFAVAQLKLPRTSVNIPLSGADGKRITIATGAVGFTLHSLHSQFYMHCSALVLPRVGSPSPAMNSPAEDFKQFQHLPLADPNFNTSGNVDIILSAADYAAILLTGVQRHPTSNIIAQNTHLGWVIFGGRFTRDRFQDKDLINCFHVQVELDQLLRRFWELEEVSVDHKLTQEDQFCIEFFDTTTTRTDNGRYVVRLPVKSESSLMQLSSTRYAAIASLRHVERRLTRNTLLHNLYHTFLAEYHALGHMEISRNHTQQRVNYLPHHSVWKESSATTKLRVVFNASKRSEYGISLNDCLCPGPKLQSDLAAVILNWRKYRIGFTADIEKMYRQILVNQQDVDLQRIVWRASEQDEPETYRLLTVTYGVNCAPFLAIKVLQTLARDEKERYPKAAGILLSEFYVDDVLSGADTVAEANQLRIELHQLLQAGGFTLRKWISNSPAVQTDILSTDSTDSAVSCELPHEYISKALGVVWKTTSDSFGYELNVGVSDQTFTKRQLLSNVAKLFDPLGFLAPVLIRGKLLFQQLWILGVNWDDELPISIQEQWLRFRTDLNEINNLEVPRWIHTSNNNTSYEYHAFADASTHAYAAVVYLKSVSASKVNITLLAAKTKIAPIKKVTIPRLELCAALLAAKLVTKIQQILKLLSVNTFLWSDSTTTIGWIQSNPGQLKDFVANRTTQILEMTSGDQWRFIRTLDNPADCASRGISSKQLLAHPLWWSGPNWLQRPECEWPTLQPRSQQNLPEMKRIQVSTSQLEPADSSIISKFSDLNKLLAVTAWCQRFISIKCRRDHATAPYCVWAERYAALKSWTKRVQQIEFIQEFKQLKAQQPNFRRSKLGRLCPMIDAEGIMRVGGRLKHSTLSVNARYPMILPKNNHFTFLVIKQAHEQLLHAGTQATLYHVRQRFWVIDGRTVVKRIIRKCMKCFRQTCQPHIQLMGQLPSQRCNVSLPFTHTGVDYAGPFYVRTTKGRGHRAYKGYVAVFVCLATKACHLELVSDMTTDAFLAALKRFIATRGLCTDLYSDCGTTFVGADALLQEEHQDLKAQLHSAAVYSSQRGINWHFIPPAAPNFGGLWEAGVKSMKVHLKRVVGTTTLTFEEFYTVLKQIEACLNSRPLTALTDDPDDVSALTPGHFLVGRPLTSVLDTQPIDSKVTPRNRWKLLSQMYHDFWRRWSHEYLQGLIARPKWRQQHRNVEIGQLALIRDERIPPNHWAMGRVVDIHTGSDGVVRVATLKTKSTILKRPVSKLSILPVEASHEDGGHLNSK